MGAKAEKPTPHFQTSCDLKKTTQKLLL